MKITACNNTIIRYSKVKKPKADIWIIHGFSESGLSFANAFDSELSKDYNIWIPDLPGFGASPYNRKLTTIHKYVTHLSYLITKRSTTQTIYIIAHSFGAVIATLLCECMNETIKAVVSVEGNLTNDDSYYSGWAGQYEDGEQFKQDFKELLQNKAKDRPEFEHYFVSATMAHPAAMLVLGKGSKEYTNNNDAGDRFLSLSCPTLYIWGDIDTPLITQKYIKENILFNYLFKGNTHWMMKENPVLFYSEISAFLNPLNPDTTE